VVIPPKKARPHPERRRGRRRALIGVLLVLLLGAAAAYGGWWFASGRYSRVPEVTGSLRGDAIQRLENAGYDVAVQPGQEFDADIAKGRVVSTQPDANTRLVRGTTVTLVISAGPQYYPVPSVQGQTPALARETLQGVGPLTVAADVKLEPSDSVPVGEVTRTMPKAGEKVTADQPITIFVSSGPPMVDVPAIEQGTPFEQARHTLKHSPGKFGVDKVEEYSDSVFIGEVIAIDPSKQARKFSTITVTVSKGPEFVQVPHISVGTSIDTATAAITNADLVPEVFSVGGSDPFTVLTITPGSGETVHAGSTVRIYALSS